MHIFLALLLVIVAGVINGSFALPTKHMKNWNNENIWLNFSFWGFLILPWLSVWMISHNVFHIFSLLPARMLWIMALGGVCFGLGQICFAFALRILGLGLAFVINIGLGTAGSTLLPILLWHKNLLNTPYAYAILIGVGLFVVGVLLGMLAGNARDKMRATSDVVADKPQSKSLLLLGLLLGVLAGVGSICQALTYIYVNPSISSFAITHFNASSLVAFNITWVGIFTGAFVPYMLYFLVLNFKNKSFKNFKVANTGKYWMYAFIMGTFFWMSLIFFSKASQELGGDLAPVIAWPMFMIFIILTSNFLGWLSKEWKSCGVKAAVRMHASIFFLIIAVFVFAYANNLRAHLVTHVAHNGAQLSKVQDA